MRKCDYACKEEFKVLINMARASGFDGFIDPAFYVAEFNSECVEAGQEAHSKIYMQGILR